MFKAWCVHAGVGNKLARHRIYWSPKRREWETRSNFVFEGKTLQESRQICAWSGSYRHDPMEVVR